MLIILVLFAAITVSAQTSLEFSPELVRQPHKIEENAPLLVQTLTAGKNSEKEKFDAIFAWVATNIRYDYRVYFSPNGTSKPDIRRMLKKKKGICLDYAFLMDSLCKLADITNVTVLGYSKDEIFDVNDSIYFDNHAWNAVKLDNLWYVYDVTWAAGSLQYDYTKFSRKILKLQRKYPFKYRKKIRQRKNLKFGKHLCRINKDTFFIYKPRRIHNFLVSFLYRYRLKVIPRFKDSLSQDFYLTEPEKFAITHFPDNPIWSLVPEQSMRAFETDSAFYHLNPQTYKNQRRSGRTCTECDNTFSFSDLKKEHYMRDQSQSLNPRNRMITSLCDYNIGMHYLSAGIEAEDSLRKIGCLDTAALFFKNSSNHIRILAVNIGSDYSLQRNKNRQKSLSLYTDNAKQTAFVRQKAKETRERTHDLRRMLKKADMTNDSYYRRRSSFGRLPDDIKHNKNLRVKESKITELEKQLDRATLAADSLQNTIQQRRTEFDSLSPVFSKQLWSVVFSHDSVLIPFLKGAWYRRGLLDDYKKPLVEERKKIYAYEKKYQALLDSLVFLPSLKYTEILDHIFEMEKARNKLFLDSYKLKIKLVTMGQIPQNELKLSKERMQTTNADDFCWLNGSPTHLPFIFVGMNNLKFRQDFFEIVIRYENESENFRYKEVNRELLRRKKKLGRIVTNNRKVINHFTKETKTHKREYLNLLKKERAEAKKAVKSK